ncbi:metal-dependent transcriptional regulator [Desulforegula conservatrix]|uniref:metal-dependent transcriptional regulator n=1 Tax=Desulforegula conservatrix TaxID=153026 RepID=UPI00041DE37C|nr:metal-dependent transcriptional regulator [Desulforegula conservatrix]
MEFDITLTASLEDYLEAIFHIVAEKQAARGKDIAKRLNVNSSSVTGALRSLSEKGYINYAPYDLITLTENGQTIAREIVRRHETLRDFFEKILKIEKIEAEETACKVEHAVSRKTLDKLISFVEFIETCPRTGRDWLASFDGRCENPSMHEEECSECLSRCISLMQKRIGDLSDKQNIHSLLFLKKGEKGTINEIGENSSIAKKLADMQASPGCIITVENSDMESGQMDIKVKGYHLKISKEDAERITVVHLK